jgi:cyclohexanone monooxygenase
MRDRGYDVIEPDRQAEDDWVDHVQETAHKTLFPKANSWYMGANIPGKPRIFTPYVGGVGVYRRTCEQIVADGYKGFHFEKKAAAAAE